MRKLIHLLYFIPACLTVGACQPDELPAEQYMSYVVQPENGLNKQKNMKGLKLKLQYRPIEYIAFQEERSVLLDEQTMQRKKAEKGHAQYYNFTIALEKGSGDVIAYKSPSQLDYNQRINYFSFNLQDDIYMVQGNDTLPCKLFQFARNYNIQPRLDFAIAFEEKEGNSGDRQFIWNDRCFGLGTVKMTIDADDVAQLPKPMINA